MFGRKKEINAFSVSAIDIFASAMGAFLLITTVILPFYPNVSTEIPRRRSDFMAAVLVFEAMCDDLDLHVIERYGGVENHYYWRDRTPDGNTPGLAIDDVHGPGTEIWELESLRPDATYDFGLDYYATDDTPEECENAGPGANKSDFELRLYHNAGFSKLRNLVFHFDGGDPWYLLRVTTDADGEFEIETLHDFLNDRPLELEGAQRSRTVQ